MPKASVREDHFAPRWKRQIGATGQITTMKPIAEAQRIHEFAHDLLGRGVGAMDERHDSTALDWTDVIHLS
jgi:hypothetical protein